MKGIDTVKNAKNHISIKQKKNKKKYGAFCMNNNVSAHTYICAYRSENY